MTSDTGSALPQDTTAPLKLADFEPQVGSSFEIATGAGVQALVLVAAQELPHSPREGGGFKLEFSGAAEPRLPQAIYAFPIDGALHDIFIVPVGLKDGGIRYEAIFF
ncbi:hypothetical protein ACCC88_04150 [Sphingomonas sp. Sphisp140]|uniref:DUF6916 family protein n=1 Tax=unclassified Sphingomonas TaxID=196159 RepID=UPI0039AF98E3